jgi:protein-S-isoprenylcysteine O-methyltransferase Ste14
MSMAPAIRVQTWAARSRSWIAIVLLVPIGVAVVFSAPRAMEGSWGDFWFDIAGWLFFLAGAILRWWSTLYIGGRKTTALVTEGPYSLCRNPIYLGTFLMCLSVAAYLESFSFAVGLLLVSWFYLSTTVPVEERRLQKFYGEAFTKYCQEVPRFLPRLTGFRSSSTIEVQMSGLISEGLRTIRWMWLPLICVLVEQLRSQSNWPHLFRLP